MNKKADIIDPRAIAADFFHRLGGMAGMVKWGRTHRSLAYQLISKLMAQPMVQNNVAVSVSADDEEATRRHLQDAFMRVIDARKAAVGDPACYVDGERIDDGRPPDPACYVNGVVVDDGWPVLPRPATIASTPQTDAETPGTPDAGVASGSNSENLKSPNQGPTFSREPALTGAAGGQKTKISYSSSIPGLYAGASLDESSDTRSSTEKYLSWPGHNRPP